MSKNSPRKAKRGSSGIDKGHPTRGSSFHPIVGTYIAALKAIIDPIQSALKAAFDKISTLPQYPFWAMLIAASLPITLNRIESLDVWFHIHYGQVMYKTMALPDLSQSYFMPVSRNISDFRYTFLGDICLYIINALGGDVGLLALKFICILISIYLLLSVNRFKYTGWTLLILIFFVLGTYQKQLVRNSLFALPLTVLLLWLFTKVRFEERGKLIWIYPPVIGIWGIVHGSYLFGFVLMVLLFLGDLIDSLRKLNTGKPKYIFVYFIIVAISFGSIYFKNPLTHDMLITPIRHMLASAKSGISYSLATPALALDSPQNQPPTPRIDPEKGILDQIKKALNNTIFHPDPELLSIDFASPFDFPGYAPVPVSLAFGLVALVALLIARPCRFSILLPFACVFILGLGYIRTIGDITVMSSWSLLTLGAGYDGFSFRFSKIKHSALRAAAPWLIAFTWTVFMIASTFAGNVNSIVGAIDSHIPGFGRFPTFDDSAYDYVLQKYRDERVFTTIATGSYALYRWYPKKKVFLDGFFAPHDPNEFKDSMQVLRLVEDPDVLNRKYQIEVALIENTRDNFTRCFRDSENWYPVAIGLGATVFRYRPDFPEDGFIPMVLFDISQVSKLPFRNQNLIAAEFYRIIISFYSKGRIKDAIDFMQRYSDLYRDLRASLPPDMKTFPDKISNAYKLLQQQYGLVNSKAMRADYLRSRTELLQKP